MDLFTHSVAAGIEWETFGNICIYNFFYSIHLWNKCLYLAKTMRTPDHQNHTWFLSKLFPKLSQTWKDTNLLDVFVCCSITVLLWCNQEVQTCGLFCKVGVSCMKSSSQWTPLGWAGTPPVYQGFSLNIRTCSHIVVVEWAQIPTAAVQNLVEIISRALKVILTAKGESLKWDI